MVWKNYEIDEDRHTQKKQEGWEEDDCNYDLQHHPLKLFIHIIEEQAFTKEKHGSQK